MNFFEWVADKLSEKIYETSKRNYNYDIPYLAGYSVDGKTLYFDRHFPEKYKNYNLHDLVAIHESTEKAMLEELNVSYKVAHQMALKAEKKAVEKLGLDWKEYDKECKKWIKKADSEKLTKIPKDLDLKPYESFHGKKDIELLNKMKKLMDTSKLSTKGIF